MKYILVLLWLFPLFSHAQEDVPRQLAEPVAGKNGEAHRDPNALKEFTQPVVQKRMGSTESLSDQELIWSPSPIKAALYSTILPGLGQAYNKKYWKIPLVWGLLGGGFYAIVYNQKRYDKWRSLYVDTINGIGNKNNYTPEQLARVQAQAQRDYSYAILFTVIFYALNVLDALVDAHLYEIDHDKDLSISPALFPSAAMSQPALGLSLHLRL